MFFKNIYIDAKRLDAGLKIIKTRLKYVHLIITREKLDCFEVFFKHNLFIIIEEWRLPQLSLTSLPFRPFLIKTTFSYQVWSKAVFSNYVWSYLIMSDQLSADMTVPNLIKSFPKKNNNKAKCGTLKKVCIWYRTYVVIK